MTNVYSYNRKTREEDEKILAAVKHHHDEAAAKGHLVVMTSLIGSQNYDLDDDNSDIDTFSLIFPSLRDLANACEPFVTCYTSSDGGHCEVKDIRLALNLLRKTSPNSVEYFTSKYKIYNPMFETILKKYLDDNSKIWHMAHCNYEHMLYAIAGMAHQLTKRNMPAGKRYSHVLRLYSLMERFLGFYPSTALLQLMPSDYQETLHAKRDTTQSHDTYYNDGCENIAVLLDKKRDAFIKTPIQHAIEIEGLQLIEQMQQELMHYYIKEVIT